MTIADNLKGFWLAFDGMARRAANHTRFNFWLLLLFFVGLGFFLIGMPKYSDDYDFLMMVRPWMAAHGVEFPEEGVPLWRTGMPWNEILDTWTWSIANNNGRLANVIAVVLLLFPKWVGSGAALICFAASVMLSLRMAGIDWKRSPLVPLAIALFMFALPWRDRMGALDYQLNYLVSSFLAILLFYYLFYRKRRRMIPAFLIALLCGAWHEGISAPALCGILCVAAVSGRWRDRCVWTAVAGLSFGLLWLFLAGYSRHLDGAMFRNAAFDKVWLEDLTAVIWPVALFILSAVVLSVRNGIGAIVADSFLLFCVVSALASSGIYIITGYSERVIWWGCFASVCGTLTAVRYLMPRVVVRYSPASAVFGAMLIALTFTHLAFVGYYTLQVRGEMKRNLELWRSDNSGSLFTSLPQFSELPWICGYLPDYHDSWTAFESSAAYWFGDDEHPNGDWTRMQVQSPVPERLRKVTADSGLPVPGSNSVRVYENCLFMPFDKDYDWMLACKSPYLWRRTSRMDFGKGFVTVRTVFVPFISKEDGRRYIYLRPHLSWFVSHFRDIKAVSLN